MIMRETERKPDVHDYYDTHIFRTAHNITVFCNFSYHVPLIAGAQMPKLGLNPRGHLQVPKVQVAPPAQSSLEMQTEPGGTKIAKQMQGETCKV